MKVIDFMSILKKHDPNTTVEAVFRDKPNLEILCDIIKAIDPKKLSRHDKRSRTLRAVRAVAEVKSTRFRTSLLPWLAEWKEEPAKFFESWSLQPEDVDGKPDYDRSKSASVESETESIVSESVSIRSRPGNIESESERIETGPERFSLTAELHKKVSQTREVISRKQADSIRWIFHALFFRDLLTRFTRSKDDKGLLPRGKGLRPLVQKACKQLTGELIVPRTIDDITVWAKVGQLYHLIGAEIGDGSLLLLSDHICRDKWIDSLPRKVSSLAPVLEPLKQLVSEEVKIYHANEVAKGIRDFQLEPYQLSLTSSKDYLDSRGPTKRHRNKHSSDSTARLKRRRILERTHSQTSFNESRLQHAAESEVRLASQKVPEQASRTRHTDSINMESHSMPDNIHQWIPLGNFDLEPGFADFQPDFADFESDLANFEPDVANFEPDFDSFDRFLISAEALST
ncbi:hypothetical protein MMC18_000711 [Xylographa bjoerkii]|nr:hypothetical protein [Xylographa bjoerkii]